MKSALYKANTALRSMGYPIGYQQKAGYIVQVLEKSGNNPTGTDPQLILTDPATPAR